jgi:hypothetical protein
MIDMFSVTPEIKLLESSRNSKVLLIAASNIENEILPSLYNVLESIGTVEKLDVLLHLRGGHIITARRIAILLRQYCEKLTFIVPFQCESSGTLLALSGDEILYGPLSIFTPIDPHLSSSGEEDAEIPSFVSSMDVKMFTDMAENWFGFEKKDAQRAAFDAFNENVFPTALGAFYRSSQEIWEITNQMLSFQLPNASLEEKKRIINELAFGFLSHTYPFTGEDLYSLGLKMKTESTTLDLSWKISQFLQSNIGGMARNSENDKWVDTLFMSSESFQMRIKNPNTLRDEWISGNINE